MGPIMKPPYYAVIFTSKRSATDDEGYRAMNDKMSRLGENMPGYLGVDSARQEIGITITYWETLEDIANWKAHKSHRVAQKLGQEKWYEWYHVQVCKVEKEYSFGKRGANE